MRGELQRYFKSLREEFERIYKIASEARSKGLDPKNYVEIKPARDLADRIEALLKVPNLSVMVRQLMKKYGKEKAAFMVAKKIVTELKDKGDSEKAAEVAIRAALAVLTDGITAAPLQGIACVKIKRNHDGSKYLAIYYAGPIRSAGGTEQALSVLVGDYIRRVLGLERYKPTKEEIERFVEELRTYEKHVGNFQYHVTDEEVRLAYSKLPVEVTGIPTDEVEVTIHRDLPRIETNKVRGGALRVVNDGIIAKARKLIPLIEELRIEGWEWLRQLILKNVTSENDVEVSDKYLEDLIAGRPVLSHPSTNFGFRIRYGRARNTGLAAIGMHPATMIILRNFIAIGTQVKTERPGKSAIVVPVDTIDGPIVKLEDGSVLQINDVELANKVKDKVIEIIFAGDILVAYGEFKENNCPLIPSGYTEEWWALEVKEALKRVKDKNEIPEDVKQAILRILKDPLRIKPNAIDALKISTMLRVPLHPKYTYLWRNIKLEDAVNLFKEFQEKATFVTDEEGFVTSIKVKLSRRGKRILELIGVPHKVVNDFIVIDEHAPVVGRIFLNSSSISVNGVKNVLELIERVSGLKIRDKVLVGTGLRVGRPEKAAPRKMNPPVHGLFPIGEGVKGRDLSKIPKIVNIEIANLTCVKCGRKLLEYKCPQCESFSVIVRLCPKCGYYSKEKRCPKCNSPTKTYELRRVNLADYLREIEQRYGIRPPRTVRVVKKLMNKERKPEPLVKALLRAKYGLFVFKDGTIRFDATNAPLTHFKPSEIGVDLDTLRSLGYTKDYKGRPLISMNQLVELKVQDVILPRKGAEYLLKVANFVDELLSRVYGMKPYYRARDIKDLIGHLIIGLAPHTSAGILGRIIGFTESEVIYAHPYWHAAKRRNCDGDEDSVILLLDAFLNFSEDYLPSQIGGMMDAPLVVTTILTIEEVDDEVFNMDTHWGYPREFYELTLRRTSPKEVKKLVETVEDRLNDERAYNGLGFTHYISNINVGPKATSYRILKSMNEKIRAQLSLARILLAVDENDVVERLLVHHLLPDIVGNLRTFSAQRFRCISCNKIFRRPPLIGHCPYCGGKIVLTVHRGNIEKYLNFINKIVEDYEVGKYLRQRVTLINTTLREMFGTHKEACLDKYLGD